MNVLIACECSGVVREAFRALGHDALSVDLKPDASGVPYPHHRQIDALKQIAEPWYNGQPWDLVIAHPPCTRLSNSGVLRLYAGGKKANGIDPVKWAEMLAGARFFRAFFDLQERLGFALCVENPVQHGHAMRAHGCARPDQIEQPYRFGNDASKATGLWLRGLPWLRTLEPVKWVRPRWVCPTCARVSTHDAAQCWLDPRGFPRCHVCDGTPRLLPRYANQTDSGQNKLAPSPTRGAQRAVTYAGIAQAMADQWGGNAP